ncbi:hypothetical protein EMCRGX_G005512 [Ephydatia muelleri]
MHRLAGSKGCLWLSPSPRPRNSESCGPSRQHSRSHLRHLLQLDNLVKTSSATSTPITCRRGVKQGCPLSPNPFDLIIEVIIRAIQRIPRAGYQITNSNVRLLTYADDLCDFASSLHHATDADRGPRRYCPTHLAPPGCGLREAALQSRGGYGPTNSPMGPSRQASGWAQRAAESVSLQRQYRANPSACVRRILSDSPSLYCNVAEDKMVTHITAAYAESPPLNPTPDWLFPPRDGKDTDGDVLSEPFSPKEVVSNSRREKNLLLAWLDIKDAFPSVSHHLMLFLMERLGLSGSVLQEGCPLSLILFNVVIEGLLRHLSASQGGYSIAGYNINTLAYADDVCVIASSKTEMQSLLDRCAEFGNWSGFRFDAKKCGSMCMVNQAPRIYATWVATSSQPSHDISTWDALLGPSEQGIKTWTP